MKRSVLVVAIICGLLFSVSVLAQDSAEIKKEIRKAAKAGDWKGLAAAIKNLGKLNDLKATKDILHYAFKFDKYDQIPATSRKEIFLAARSALGKITESESLAYLKKQLAESRKWEIRALIAEVFTEKKTEDVLDALHTQLQEEKQPEVLRELVLAVKKHARIESVDYLIELLARIEKDKGTVWIDVRKTLTALTNADYKTAADWRNYWNIRKKEMEGETEHTKQSKPATGKVITSLEEEKKKAPRFFGKEILSKRFIFVIDISQSMTAIDPPPDKPSKNSGSAGRSRIDRVKNELLKMIEALDSATKFNIIAYSVETYVWQKQLVRGTKKAKQSATQFVQQLKFRTFTWTDKAIKEAWTNKEADTMALLSDGAPTHIGNYTDTEGPNGLIAQILGWVANANKVRKMVINTFGFDQMAKDRRAPGQQAVKFLKDLASQNGGTYTSIP